MRKHGREYLNFRVVSFFAGGGWRGVVDFYAGVVDFYAGVGDFLRAQNYRKYRQLALAEIFTTLAEIFTTLRKYSRKIHDKFTTVFTTLFTPVFSTVFPDGFHIFLRSHFYM